MIGPATLSAQVQRTPMIEMTWPDADERLSRIEPLDLIMTPVTVETNLVSLIRDVGCTDLSFGPWVAGGAARAVFEGVELRSPSDIDYFGGDLISLGHAEKSIRTATKIITSNVTRNNSLNIETSYRPSWQKQKAKNYKFQIIRSGMFENLASLFHSFDFTICQFATDGRNIIHSRRAAEDVRKRVLRYTAGYPEKRISNYRIIKYMNRGFTPLRGVITRAVTRSDNIDVVINDNGTFFINNTY